MNEVKQAIAALPERRLVAALAPEPVRQVTIALLNRQKAQLMEIMERWKLIA